MATEKNYDGFYFLPGDEEGAMNIAYFDFTDSQYKGEPIEAAEHGDKYHIAFFKLAGEKPVFDEHFEAIFSDPVVYVKNLLGSGLYGCVLRKTDKSANWWSEYLTSTKNLCKLYVQ